MATQQQLPPDPPGAVAPFDEQQFTAAFEFAGVGMALLDTCARALRVNRAFCLMLGRTADELLGAGLSHACHPGDAARDAQLLGVMLEGSSPSHQFDTRYLHKDGRTVWAHQTCTLVRDCQGRPTHFIVQAQDLSERRAAEAALRDSEERFRATFEQAALGILHIGLDGRLLRANRAACEMHGFSLQEMLALHADDLLGAPVQGRDADVRSLLEGTAKSYAAERTFRRKDASIFPARIVVTMVRSEDGSSYFASIVEDLSAQKEAQRRIREQAQMLDQANDAIIVHSLDRRIRAWNCGAQRLFGFPAEQAIGRTLAELVGPESALPEQERLRMLEDGVGVALVRCRRADGAMLDVERRFTVVRDEQGRPSAVLSVNTDVTGRLRAQRELEALNAALEQRVQERTAQLESSNDELRSFAYSLAHDLRAPLAAIDGFSLELARRLGDMHDATCRHYLSRVRAGVKLMSDLTDAMLSLAHLSDAPLLQRAVDLSAVAQAWCAAVRERDAARQVEVVIHPTPPALGDVRLLTDVLENLLGNAWKFTSRRSEARIEFGAQDADGQLAYFVRDNGAGFDGTYADKLFAPFQRLHAAGDFPGTGIGLAIVRKIVLRHGGRVWAQSREGEGACFYFTLGEAADAAPVPG
ncbi:MAG TPA: PAS domain S-box protein [Ramlibacter sp.]|nr:PAS domain S-box protein [Ramlibacter sp.]